MKSKILAFVMGGVLKFEGVHMRSGVSGGDVKALRKWMESSPKAGPWVCKVCQQSVGTEGERVAVWVDLDDPSHFQVMHRQHAD